VRIQRVGAVAVAALAIALGAGGVAAASTSTSSSSTSSAGFSVRAGDLVLARAAGQYTGTMQVSVHNNSQSPVTDAMLTVKVPAGLRFTGATSGFGCVGMSEVSCGLDTFAAGERRTIAVSFGSYAGPEQFARVTERGTVTVGGAASKYTGILKSVSGSVRHPRPYRPSTAYDLAVRAGGRPVVTRDASGVSVRLPVIVKDRTDAFNDGGSVGVAIDGSDQLIFPTVDPSEPCTLVCPVPGVAWLAKGEVRSFGLLFTLPADTPAGTYVARVHGDMNAGTGTPPVDVTPQNNTVAFTVTVPAA
jgi:hypothetical protein